MGFQKNEYFLGYEEIVDITKLDFGVCVPGRVRGGISIHFKDFLKVKVQNLIFFWCRYNIFWGGGGGMPKFLIFFGVNSTFVDAGS